jgi:DNA-binding response OmpR family regulator
VTLPRRQTVATVVVCEDDEPTLELLCDNLEADRFHALPAPCHFKQPDLMVLDLGLPDAFGLDVLREIRGADGATGRYDPELPVIVLSGRSSPSDRVRGLRCGADDYLVKPFAYDELAERIRALGRRGERRRQGPLRVGEIFIDTSRREVTVNGRPVKLANKEFALLRALAAEPMRVFSKDELLRDVWGFRTLGRTRTLDSHASRLRRKLDPESGRYVVNVWGYGYRLIDGPDADDRGDR